MKRILTSLFLGAVLLSSPIIASAQEDAKEILDRYKTEPTVEATMEAALEYHKPYANPPPNGHLAKRV